MPRVFAIANQKGGVAKTTTTQTVGLALADLGERVLLVDLDPQACLTFALGLEPEACAPTLHDVLLERVKAGDAIVDAGRVQLLPANIDLAGSELHLLSKTGREHAVRRALDSVRDSYDTMLIDCPPSLGVLTVNGLDRRRRGARSAPMRSARPSRCRAVARDDHRRPRVHQSPACRCAA